MERGVLNEAGRISGRAQAAVRPISMADFNRILERGIPDEEPLLPRVGAAEVAPLTLPLRQEPAPSFFGDVERERVEVYISRPVRDRVFRRNVLEAYDCRCAITGLKFINGGGRAEVQAARISSRWSITGWAWR